MSYVTIVLGIKPYYGRVECHDLEVCYVSGNNRMRLDLLDDRPGKHNSAQKELVMHGLHWKAYKWRLMDGLSEWEYANL
jgi:hypothetical protein